MLPEVAPNMGQGVFCPAASASASDAARRRAILTAAPLGGRVAKLWQSWRRRKTDLAGKEE